MLFNKWLPYYSHHQIVVDLQDELVVVSDFQLIKHIDDVVPQICILVISCTCFLHFLFLTSKSATGDFDKFTCIPLSIACCSLTKLVKSWDLNKYIKLLEDKRRKINSRIIVIDNRFG